MNKPKRIIALLLAVLLLATPLTLTGCGSLSRIMEQPEPPRTAAKPLVLDNLLRNTEEYQGIEIMHGSWEEPLFSPDRDGYLYEYRGWIYLHIEGEPAQRGYQYGWLLADYIQRYVDANKKMLGEFAAIDWDYFRENAQQLWADKLDTEVKAELEGIVAGAAKRDASFDYLDLLVLNGLEELRDSWFPTMRDAYYAELAAGRWNLLVDEGEDDDAKDAEAADDADDAKDAEDAKDADEAEGAEAAKDAKNAEDAEAEDTAVADTADTGADGAKDAEDAEDADGAKVKDDDEPLLSYIETDGTTSTAPGAAAGSFTNANIYPKQASAILATGSATEDGKIILAQNTIASYADASFSNVMLDVEPKDGQRFTMQSAPGLVYSTGQAYSSESLVVANTQISGFAAYALQPTPAFCQIRQAVQYAKTLDEFTEAMTQEVSGGLASSWLVGELKTNQIMELEVGLAFFNVQKLTDGCFINFDGVDDERIVNYETEGAAATDIRLSTGARFVRLAQLSGLYQGKLTAEIAQTIIADHYDIYTKKSTPSSRSICAHYEVDDAEFVGNSGAVPYMPYGTVDAKVITSDLAKDYTILARWGSACGKAFDSKTYLKKNPQFSHMQEYLYDRPSEFWAELYPIGQDK